MGIMQVFFFIPYLPEIIERLQVDLKIKDGKDEWLDARLNDRCNDAFGLIFSSCMFIAPLIGS
jgi:hypothetical protein